MTDLEKDAVINTVTRLLVLALETNGCEKRQRKDTGTLPTVFFEYSGHVNTLDFRIYEDGWQSGDMGYRNWDIDISKPIPEKTVEGIENFCALCLEDKKESDVLSRDITKLMNNINEEKEQLKRLRKKYRKLLKEGR